MRGSSLLRAHAAPLVGEQPLALRSRCEHAARMCTSRTATRAQHFVRLEGRPCTNFTCFVAACLPRGLSSVRSLGEHELGQTPPRTDSFAKSLFQQPLSFRFLVKYTPPADEAALVGAALAAEVSKLCAVTAAVVDFIGAVLRESAASAKKMTRNAH